MKTLISLLILSTLSSHLVLCRSIKSDPSGPPLAPPASVIFYESLLDGIDRFSGSVTFELNTASRNWTTAVPGTKDVHWDLRTPPAPEAGKTMATAFFKFKGGTLEQGASAAKVVFEPALTATRTPAAGALVIGQITFSETGTPVEYKDDKGAVLDVSSWNEAPIRFADHMKIFTKPRELLQKGPFGWTATPKSTPVPGPLFLNMKLTEVPAGGLTNAGLLMDDTSINLDAASELQFRVGDQSAFVVKSLKYNFVSKELDGELSGMSLMLHSGRLKTNGLDLLLGEAARVRFARVLFKDSGGGSSLVLSGGSLVGTIRQGSYVQLAPKIREASLSTDVDSTVGLFGVEVSVSGAETKISAGTGSGMAVRLLSARLPLMGRDYMNFRQGTISLGVTSAEWKSGGEPKTQGEITLLAATIQSGRFSMRHDASVPISGGVMRGSGLRFDSAAAQSLTGRFTDVTFEIEDGTSFELPQRFLAVTRSGTRLVANDMEAPFTLAAGATTAAGTFRAVIPFWTCYAPPAGSPVIRDSMLKSTITLFGNGTNNGTDEIVDYTCCSN